MVAFLDVWNLECSNCGVWVRSKLLQLDGVLKVDVIYEKGVVVVTYDSAQTTTENLVACIATAGDDVCRFYGAALIGNIPARKLSV